MTEAEIIAAATRAFDATASKVLDNFRAELRASAERHASELAALRAEVVELRQQVEAKGMYNPADWWAGPWREGAETQRGFFTQDKGHSWLCLKTTRGRPGECRDFSMFSKGGRNGRDALDVREHRGNGHQERAPWAK
jgi:hypothetical protein